MTPDDRLVLLELLGVRVALTPDGEHLDVTGPVAVLSALSPKLTKERARLVDHLRGRSLSGGDSHL